MQTSAWIIVLRWHRTLTKVFSLEFFVLFVFFFSFFWREFFISNVEKHEFLENLSENFLLDFSPSFLSSFRLRNEWRIFESSSEQPKKSSFFSSWFRMLHCLERFNSEENISCEKLTPNLMVHIERLLINWVKAVGEWHREKEVHLNGKFVVKSFFKFVAFFLSLFILIQMTSVNGKWRWATDYLRIEMEKIAFLDCHLIPDSELKCESEMKLK